RPIHHSDRGAQYCSDRYVHLLLQHGIGISQTQSGDPHDNAKAERINGTIKNEYLRHTEPGTFNEALQEVITAVDLYNGVRPHLSLNKQTPLDVHSGTATKPIIQLWKTKAWKKQTITEQTRAVQTLL
ncbi:MAG: transposase, partial [Candidatus Kapabacteria bacterium]|nr:transposase [Candidatus Kapabacteria bacterium]MBU3699468.1 transposase [Candidatus Kapabacteria bacterium]